MIQIPKDSFVQKHLNMLHPRSRIYLEEKEYLLLAPMEDKESEDIYVFRIDEVEGKQELNLVEDDKEFIAVKKEYNNCFLFPILSLTHPAIGAPNPKTNK